jgi:hypothetical protein
MFEIFDQLGVEGPLEGNDQCGQFGEIRPFPSGKFRFLGGDVDIRVTPQEPKDKPFLGLSAEPAAP